MDENVDTTCKRECSICLRDLHLSAICCSCSEDKFACLNHAKQLCFCPWSNKTLLYRYEISELNVLCQAVDGKLSSVYKWATGDLGLTVHSLSSKRSNQTPENVGGSTHPSKDLKMKEPMPQKGSDAYSEWKQLKSQSISNASKRKQNEVASQVKGTSSSSYGGFRSKMKKTILLSTIPDERKAKEKMPPKSISGGKNSAGIKNDMKAIAGKRTISKKVEGNPKVSKVSSVINSSTLSFLRENTLFEISSDSSSTSASSESDDDT